MSSFVPVRRPQTLAPILIGCAFVAIAFARQTRLGAWLRGFFSARDPDRHRLSLDLPFPILRERILGRSKSSVLLICGSPRTAAVSTTTLSNAPALWRADTWYYPLDARTQTAMAIRFINDIAREIDFFGAPEFEN